MNTIINPEAYTKDTTNFIEMLQWVAHEVGLTNKETKDMIHFNLNAFIDTMTGGRSPEQSWDPIGTGAFKECYNPIGYRQFVIKFVTEENRTDDEMHALDMADEAEVGHWFIPTMIMPLTSNTLPADVIAENCDGSSRYIDTKRYNTPYTQYTWTIRTNEDWRPSSLVYCMVQPRAHILQDMAWEHLIHWEEVSNLGYVDSRKGFEEWYLTHPLIADGAVVNSDLVWRMSELTNAYEWWQRAVEVYGVPGVEKLLDFCNQECIHDLHEGNIGFIVRDGEDVPIITDWLSW